MNRGRIFKAVTFAGVREAPVERRDFGSPSRAASAQVGVT